MGKFGKVDGGVAVDGLGTHQTAIDGVEVEDAMDGMVGESERHCVVHLVKEGEEVATSGERVPDFDDLVQDEIIVDGKRISGK